MVDDNVKSVVSPQDEAPLDDERTGLVAGLVQVETQVFLTSIESFNLQEGAEGETASIV